MRVTDTHVYFWGGEFSNWYTCNITYKGHQFYSSEQAFMWEKAMFFGDEEIAKIILRTPDPSEAKKLGRKVKDFNIDKWLFAGYQFMIDINVEKYKQNEDLKIKLFSTGDKVFVEASPYDKICGVGLKETDDNILDENKWNGLNLLGKALIEVREKLK